VEDGYELIFTPIMASGTRHTIRLHTLCPAYEHAASPLQQAHRLPPCKLSGQANISRHTILPGTGWTTEIDCVVHNGKATGLGLDNSNDVNKRGEAT
jgi:hypothetical protein